jgi:hypothetical protein
MFDRQPRQAAADATKVVVVKYLVPNSRAARSRLWRQRWTSLGAMSEVLLDRPGFESAWAISR